MQNDFYSIKEFALVMRVHENTIRRAIKNGRISAIRMGSKKKSHYRIAKSEIDRLGIISLEAIVDGLLEKKLKPTG